MVITIALTITITMVSVCTKYCILAALLLTFLPGDLTYVIVAGLFLVMKVIIAINAIKVTVFVVIYLFIATQVLFVINYYEIFHMNRHFQKS